MPETCDKKNENFWQKFCEATEFLYYWDDVAEEGKIDIYLGDDSKAKKLNVYLGKDEMRCVAHGISLNDKEKKDGDNCYWKHRADICAYYIPLIDKENRMGKKWHIECFIW